MSSDMWCDNNDDNDARRSVVNGVGAASTTSEKRSEPHCLCFPQEQRKLKRTSFLRTDDSDKQRTEDDVVDVVNLAKDLNELTFQERERAMDEVHGVAKIPEETPEFVANSVEALDRAISLVPKRKRRAIEKAYFLRPSFATDTQFKLLFLRAEEFDATNAATRMIAYFDAKRILFGDAKLAKKRVTLDDDLSPSDIQSTYFSQATDLPKCGKGQYVDSSGRSILFCNLTKLDFDNVHGVARGVWSLVMSMILPEDNDEKAPPTTSSIKGICLFCHIPPDSRFKAPLSKVIDGCRRVNPLFVDCLPYRFTSVHYCYDNPAMRTVISVMQRFHSKRARVRMRMHVGSPVEIRYALLPFGIRCPPNVVRIPESDSTNTTDNNFETEMNEYLEHRREMERRQETVQLDRELDTGMLVYPRNYLKDVLVGRGQSCKDHPGNRFHHSLIDSSLEQYAAAIDNFAKTCVSMRVVQTIHDTGGRFLMLDSVGEKKGWKILESSIARDKTSATFRTKIANKQKDGR